MTSPRHLPNIDIMRGMAVLAVVAHHVFAFTGFSVPVLGTFGGLLGVQLFFVLSGYLITESASKHPTSVYWLHRVLRIFPAYWVAYLLVGVLTGRLIPDRIIESPFPFFLNLVNLQQLHAVALFEFDVISVSWTLTVEVLWYALAPLLLLIGFRRPWHLLAGLMLLSVAWTWMASHRHLDELYRPTLEQLSRPWSPSQLSVLIGAAFPAQLIYFGLGSVAYHLRDRLSTVSAWTPGIAWLVCLGAMPFYFNHLQMATQVVGLGVAALFVWMLRMPALKLRFLAWTGQISYSIYLLHFPLIVYGFQKLGRHGPVHLLVTLAVIYLCAYALYRWVERPGIQLARRWTRPQAPVSTGI
jgi:peptidoglycan/LPS O-acetylase OafA/YrhL